MSTGYRNPPRSGQFKKGQSGNPKGRPKGKTQPVSTAYLFYKIASEQVAIEIDGNEVTMTRWEALVRQVQTLALSRDARAVRLMHQMRRRFPGNAPRGDKYLSVVSDDDMKL
ncbi:DUF5681 domain-containing protein [Bradyrhizobium sp. Ash2021]|uniref:DUF5681 domain-containing protein n=1 Tax=Bradyrhizobium sp. Ash2021 TaxID=2954771 RepID=UPI002814FD55|nr:DUF5681 domain-containing protein [Bradyrhizobium sp. Ash2021]WMT79544.1 DUF5681 domain-containing protein [Bradyrhizobium sp. Ash2021]